MFKVVDPNSSIYVELTASGASHVVEFPPAEERAFVVGSTERASLRVSGVGVAPVQFHLEREDDAIWLIPAYGIADLTVNAISVLGPTPLAERSVIEFCNVRVYAAAREADPLSGSDDRFTTQDVSSKAARASYSLRLPGENDSTVLAMRPVRPSAAPPPAIEPGGNREELRNTLSLSHDANDSDMSATGRQSRVDGPMVHRRYQDMQRLLPNSHVPGHGADEAPDFTLYGTQIMAPYRPPPELTPEIDSVPQREESPGAPEPKVVQEIRPPVNAEQFGGTHAGPRPQLVPSRPRPTPREPLGTADPTTLESAVTPPALGRHPLALATPDEDPVLHEERWGHRRATGIPASSTNPLSPLARLGLLTKARPLLVGCFTGVGAALLVILFLGVTRLTEAPPRSTTRPLLADLKSLCPTPLAPVPTQAPKAASVSIAPAEAPQVHGSAGTGAPTAHPDHEPHKPDEQPRSRVLH